MPSRMSRKDVKAAVDLSISTKWVVKEGRHTFKNLLWSKVHEICTHPEADDFTFVIDSILQTGTREMYHTRQLKSMEKRLKADSGAVGNVMTYNIYLQPVMKIARF